MIASSVKNTQIRRLLLIIGVVCVTTIALVMSPIAGFPPMSFVHAMGLPFSSQTLCVSASTREQCTNQDPVGQGCSRDAETIAYETFLSPATGNILATAERRYSPACHTYWGRIVEPVTGKRGLSIVIALKGGPPPASTTTATVVFTNMVFLSCQATQMAPIIGTMSLSNGANPAANGVAGLAATLAAIPSPLHC